MDNFLNRTELLIGTDNVKKLQKSHVAVFGIGGVGSYTVEALVRAGIYNISIIDNDIIDITNINRQLIADTSVIGKSKVEVEKERLLKINPELNIKTYMEFYDSSKNDKLISSSYDYIVDAIDNINSKISLIVSAKHSNIPIISSMGTGNKLNPALFEVSDIYKTSMCPLAKIIRKELRKNNIQNLKVVYSKEKPVVQNFDVIPSISFVPSVCGLLIAGEVINDIIKK